MTTQNTHHEHNDVDQSVVEYPSASGTTTVDSTTSEKRLSPEIQGEATRLVEEQTSTPSKTEPIPSNQTQEPSDNPVPSETVNQADSSLNIQATSEPSIPHQTVAHGDEILQAEGQPGVDKAQAQEEPQSLTLAEQSSEAEQNKNADGDKSIEKTSPVETQSSEGNIPTEEPQTDVGETPLPLSPSSVNTQVVELEQTQSEVSPDETARATPSSTDGTPLQSEPAQETSSSFPYKEIAPLINTTAEEVRPFTKFIEEFRLAEAARLQSTLRESQVEAFGLLNSVETISSEDTSTGKPTIAENREGTETTEGTHMHAEAKQPTNTEPKDPSATEQKTPTNPANRPVSPLLRPATRLRVPRHGLVRHPREEQQTDEGTLPTVQKAQTDQRDAGATVLPIPTNEPVSPKPARRYRFDRPSSNTTNAKNGATVPNSTTASILPTLNESLQPTVPAVLVNDSPAQDKATREAPTNRATHLESAAPVPEQEEVTPQAGSLVEPTMLVQPSEQGRRRHIHHKEQAAPTPHPVVEPPTPAGETATNTDEIAPEDLPPLEYSELQKGGPSRRRRRRSGSSSIASPIVNIGNDASAPGKPAPTESSLLSSQAPAGAYQPPTSNGVYNIVSGYTLNQMNQGNEIVGPFMGPEPSPARGSVQSHDNRAARGEVQRTPIAPASFASRPTEHGLHTPSAASMTQFANIVSQAIQTQTDRMVAELRRANQAPANVSVNLPPFPSTERVGVFVDVANLLYSARTLRMAVDFGKLLDFLRGNRRLVRAHAYCPTSPQPGDEQMFLQAVKGLGYRITTKNYKTFSSGAKKADLDLDLCMDVVRLVDGRAVDCVVLVSGDSDFMPMLDYCSDHGVRVEVAAFDEAMSATLRQSCDLFVNLSMLEEIRA